MLQKLFIIFLASLLSLFSYAQSTEELQKLLANDGLESDEFGYSVYISGDYMIIGALEDEINGNKTGSAYMFYNNSGNWEQHTKLIASDGEANDNFGKSVCISGDYAIIGAVEDNDNGINSGSAYIFYNNSGVWQQQQKLIASDGEAGDLFGKSVGISGNYAIVGAYWDDDYGSETGAAFIFYNNAGNWQQIAKLKAYDTDAGDRFGYSVGISEDYAIIGAVEDDDDGSKSGSAYIFHNNAGIWEEYTKLTADDAAAGDKFGISAHINNDYAIIGSYEDDDNGYNSGSAYIFKNISENWQQISKLNADDADSEDKFGFSVGITDNYAIVGAWWDDDNGYNSGSAYLFNNNNDNWSQYAKYTASDGTSEDNFGCFVSISGHNAIVGAYNDDDNGINSGSAYVFSPIILPYVINQPFNQTNICNNETVEFSVISTDTESYQWRLSEDNGSTWSDLSNNSIYTGVSTNTLSVLMNISLDGNQYSCIMTNTNGSIESNSATLTFDSEPPAVPILEELTSECSLIVSIPTTIDNCSGTLNGWTTDPLIYSEQGHFTIQWTFDDGNGNHTDVEQIVNINDNTPPVINCITDQEINTKTYLYVIPDNQFDPININDNCGIYRIFNDLNDSETLSGEILSKGINKITWTVIDVSGNENQCSFNILVNTCIGSDKSFEDGVLIYPNPTDGIFTIQSNDSYMITITDIIGKKIADRKIMNESININLTNYACGVYFLTFKNQCINKTSKIIIPLK